MPAKKDGGSGNDLIFCSREATNDSFLAKITSRPILAGFGLRMYDQEGQFCKSTAS